MLTVSSADKYLAVVKEVELCCLTVHMGNLELDRLERHFMLRLKFNSFTVVLVVLLKCFCGDLQAGETMRNVIVCAEKGKFCGWPANNGVWIWDGKEILVGLSIGDFIEHDGHNMIRATLRSVNCRSLDGGQTWTLEDPECFVGDGGDRRNVPDELEFTNPGFAMRIGAVGYWASEEKRGELFFSSDRGRTWIGPCAIKGLLDHPELEGVELTSRTDYQVIGPSECLLFCSARNSKKWKSDRTFVARSIDGGKSFEFVNWIVRPTDPYRAVMPSSVRCSDNMLVAAIRRRYVGGSKHECWIDLCVSEDNGNVWSFLSRGSETGVHNGNPPGLVSLKDGRLCLVYGNRSKRQMLARLSSDQGRNWGKEVVLRDDYQTDSFNDADLGYPRVVQRADGKLVAIYYWATKENPHHHIAGTIWEANDY